MNRRIAVFALLTCAGLISSIPAHAAEDLVLGTTNRSTGDYNVGRALCWQLSRSSKNISCSVRPVEKQDTAEPLAVLSDVRNGAIEFGIVRSDWQYHAYKGSGPVKFMDVKFDNIRSLLSLHAEAFNIIVRKDANINGLQDLTGKRVNIGDPGSIRRQLMNIVMQALGWTTNTFQMSDQLNEAEQSLALCHNRVQAIVVVTAHPNSMIEKTLSLCNAKIIGLSADTIAKIKNNHPYLVNVAIPANTYASNSTSIYTFGLTSTLVSAAETDTGTVFTIVKSLLDNFDGLRHSHVAFRGLDLNKMKSRGLTAPIHSGAQQFYNQ